MQAQADGDWLAEVVALAKAAEGPMPEEEVDRAWETLHSGMHQIDSERQWARLVQEALGDHASFRAAAEVSLDRALAIGTIKMALITSLMATRAARIRGAGVFGHDTPPAEEGDVEVHDAIIEADTVGEAEIVLQEHEGRIILLLQARPEYETRPPRAFLLRDTGEKLIQQGRQQGPGGEYEIMFADVRSGRYLLCVE